MTNIDKAPDFPGPGAGQEENYPSKGRRLGPAWQEIWDMLRKHPQGMDRITLAEGIAPRYDLAPGTLVALIGRAAAAGVLTSENAPPVTVPASRQTKAGNTVTYDTTRVRKIYRIKDGL